MSTANVEFSVQGAHAYDRRSASRWLWSHAQRYWGFMVLAVVLALVNSAGQAAIGLLTGRAFDLVSQPDFRLADLRTVALQIMLIGLGYSLAQLGRNFAMEVLAQRTERDAREELYQSLLGKSQTFHDRQRVGDIMARATDDVTQINLMINPGIMLLLGSGVFLIIPPLFIAFLRFELLLTPVLFIIALYFSLRDYTRRLNPVAMQSRMSFGAMNAGLQETIEGIEVVKSSAQEAQERAKFLKNAQAFRQFYVKQGVIEGAYLPLLLLSLALAGGFVHALLLYRQGTLAVGEIISYMSIFGLFGFPTFISIFTFSLVEIGFASAARILTVINDRP